MCLGFSHVGIRETVHKLGKVLAETRPTSNSRNNYNQNVREQTAAIKRLRIACVTSVATQIHPIRCHMFALIL